MSLVVLNASNPVYVQRESDKYVNFQDGYESCFRDDLMVKKAISWHSIAAVMGTEFLVYEKDNWQNVYNYQNVLILIKDDLNKLEPLVDKLKLMKKNVFISFHENMDYFFLKSLEEHFLEDFIKLANKGTAYFNLNSNHNEYFKSLLDVPVHEIFHGYPYSIWHPSFVDNEFIRREGIIIGTRTVSQWLRRDTLSAIVTCSKIAQKANTCVTYLCESNDEKKWINKTNFVDQHSNVRIESKSRSYEDWLKLLAQHEYMFQYDRSETFGQVVADCLITNTIPFSSNTVVDRIMNEDRKSFDELVQDLDMMYDDDFSNVILLSKQQKMKYAKMNLDWKNQKRVLEGILSNYE